MTAAPGPESIAQAFVDDIARLCSEHWPGWIARGERVTTIVLGIGVSDFNNLYVAAGAAPGAIEDALDRLLATGLPCTVSALDPDDAETPRIAVDRGLRAVGRYVVLGVDRELAIAPPDGATIVRCAEPDMDEYREVLMEGFGMPAELAALIGGSTLLADSSVRAYLGRDGAQATSTSLSILDGEIACIYSVATTPAHRRRGHGAAVTARAVDDALAAGARWAILHPSPVGAPLYEAMGFAEIGGWERWVFDGQ